MVLQEIENENGTKEEVWRLYRDEKGNLARPPKEMFDDGLVKTEFNQEHERHRTIWNAQQHNCK